MLFLNLFKVYGHTVFIFLKKHFQTFILGTFLQVTCHYYKIYIHYIKKSGDYTAINEKYLFCISVFKKEILFLWEVGWLQKIRKKNTYIYMYLQLIQSSTNNWQPCSRFGFHKQPFVIYTIHKTTARRWFAYGILNHYMLHAMLRDKVYFLKKARCNNKVRET